MSMELVLFFTTVSFCQQARQAGISTFMIDFERRGKTERQKGYATQINQHSMADLALLRREVGGHAICRVNGWYLASQTEIRQAIDHGADEILLPMVRSAAEIESALAVIQDQCRFSIMLETPEAVERAQDFAGFPLRRVYVGLNDLYIEQRTPNLFYPLIDGTLDRIFEVLQTTPLGFAGLTLPGCGFPLPGDLLIAEMARRNAAFAILRRSFLRDVEGHDLAESVFALKQAVENARSRPHGQQQSDYQILRQTVEALPSGAWLAT